MAASKHTRKTIASTNADQLYFKLNRACSIFRGIEEQADLILDTCASADHVDPENSLIGMLLAIKAMAKLGYSTAESAMEERHV